MASSSTQQTHGTQEQETGTPSTRHTMEAGPSCTVTETLSQSPYPLRSPSVASRTSQTSYEKTTFLARARATTKALLRRHTLPAHLEDDPPQTVRAPVPQLPPFESPDREWSSRLKKTSRLHDTGYLVSSLMGMDPQATMRPFTEGHLSPIMLGLILSPTPKSPVLQQPTIPMSPALSPRYEPGAPPTELPEESHPLPPPQVLAMDLDEAIWRFLTNRLAVPPPVLRNATIDDLFHHFTHSLLEDPTWLLMTAGRDYMYFTNIRQIGVEYILREETAVYATSTWNRVHPWNERMTVPPGYDPNLAESPKPMTLTPEIPPRHANVPEYPSRPPSHEGRPIGRHPMGGQHAGGADPGGDQGGHVEPPDLADPELRSLPWGPNAPMPPNPPDP
ncbi:uncharacterized protein ARMOST_10376 [Armillaria ostoyae]|uniref:Uncharacterized protein n=1 Tax=Armillaria ostoyae TaxID=47428 RepID=A0A284RE43_ARMOS|nr:uncharacterized protein ARMOST_10376 [Armillaria ostoyae]